MINSTVVTGALLNPTQVFISTEDGVNPISLPSNPGQTSAVTSIILCNTSAGSLTDETVGVAKVNIFVVPQSIGTTTTATMIVSGLTIPAGETVFFSDERIILDAGDYIYVGSDVSSAITVTVSSIPV